MGGKLNEKQKLFVREYLIDKNATRAAKAAGYSAKTAYAMGAENLRKPQIKKLIDAQIKKQSDNLDITAERVIKRIGEIAFANPKKHWVKHSDTLKACELLGKHFKIFTDVVETSGPNGGPQVIITLPSNGREAKKNG